MGNMPMQFGLFDAHYSNNVVALRTWSDEGDSSTKLSSLHPGVDDVGMSVLLSSTSDARV